MKPVSESRELRNGAFSVNCSSNTSRYCVPQMLISERKGRRKKNV